MGNLIDTQFVLRRTGQLLEDGKTTEEIHRSLDVHRAKKGLELREQTLMAADGMSEAIGAFLIALYRCQANQELRARASMLWTANESFTRCSAAESDFKAGKP